MHLLYIFAYLQLFQVLAYLQFKSSGCPIGFNNLHCVLLCSSGYDTTLVRNISFQLTIVSFYNARNVRFYTIMKKQTVIPIRIFSQHVRPKNLKANIGGFFFIFKFNTTNFLYHEALFVTVSYKRTINRKTKTLKQIKTSLLVQKFGKNSM